MDNFSWAGRVSDNVERAKKTIEDMKENRNNEIRKLLFERSDTINKLICHYGPENQLLKANEEIDELYAVVSGDKAEKFKNLGLYRKALKTEIADVLIMAYQIMRIATDFATENNFTVREIIDEVDFKINRQFNRIAAEKDNKL
jgi:uncharacterized protein YjgD (DUF1641 family)